MFTKCALNLAEDGRILSAWNVLPNGKYDGMPIVDILPTGKTEEEQDITNWRVGENGEYIYDPKPKNEKTAQPTQLDLIEAQVTYTALMTDTLLEV